MIEISDVELDDEARLRQWYDAYAAAQAGRPTGMVESWEVARVALPRRHPDFQVALSVAEEDDG